MIRALKSLARTIVFGPRKRPMTFREKRDETTAVEIAAQAIYSEAPSIGGDTENGWHRQSALYQSRCRDIAFVVLRSVGKEAE